MKRWKAAATIAGVVAVAAGGVAYWRYSTRAPRKSQPASVMQMLGATRISVHYNRPSARGRTLFGGIVPYGQVWDPGADEATTFETDRPIIFAGQALASGSYSVWAIPDSAEWTVILSRAAHVYHIPYPEGHDALRVRIRPAIGPYVETLAFELPQADATHALLVLHWGTTMIDIPIATR
ncbi:MAG TPA: DUF2911 domain-containing protein [Gemmatimonadaceae bacterium]|nr:DUF2911 domain-containing protein [Gemmatimonadaceae bacterium]